MAIAARRGLSRREILGRIGAIGGSAAIVHAATSFGIFASSPRQAFQMPPNPSSGTRPKVAILGAGIAGLCAAYELGRAGYDCTILEASHRIGGRSFTVRNGTVIDELGNRQVCDFDAAPHLYFNAGPARIPGLHHRLLGYCRDLGVALEPFINVNYNAWVHDRELNGGRPVRHRQIIADARGFMAEMMAKTLRPDSLDQPVSVQDMEALLASLKRYGDLAEDLSYLGTSRAGHLSGGMMRPGTLNDRLSLHEIILAQAASFGMNFAQSEFQAPSLMQPVGGMDRIVAAFASQIKADIHLHSMVTDIRNRPDGVDIVYSHKGQTRSIAADYCLNAIPGHLMRGISNNFDDDYRRCLDKVAPGKLSKLGVQFSRRFWEEEGIYGGISWTDHDILQLWYPSHGAHSEKGIMLGAYIFFGDANDRFARMTHQQRLTAALEAGEAIHPGRYEALAETSVSVSWQRMNHMLGCAGTVLDDPDSLARLQQPHGRHYLIGDQVSLHPGWQEGAVASAHFVLADLATKERARHG